MSPKLELPSTPAWRPTFGRRNRTGAEDAPEDVAATAPDDACADGSASRRTPPTAAALVLLLVVFVAALVVRNRLGD
jgi:hypothetical protein